MASARKRAPPKAGPKPANDVPDPEKEQILKYWQATASNLENAKSSLLQRDEQMEAMQAYHKEEILETHQKMKLLLFEHEDEMARLKQHHSEELESLQDARLHDQNKAWEAQDKLKSQLHLVKLNHQQSLEELERTRIKAMADMVDSHSREVAALHERYIKQSRESQVHLESVVKLDKIRSQEAHDKHVKELLRERDAAQEELKEYFGDVTTSSLDKIKSLKTRVTQLEQASSAKEKLVRELSEQNRALKDPLASAQSEMKRLRCELEDHHKAKDVLRIVKGRVRTLEVSCKHSKWELEVARESLAECQNQNSELQKRLQSAERELERLKLGG